MIAFIKKIYLAQRLSPQELPSQGSQRKYRKIFVSLATQEHEKPVMNKKASIKNIKSIIKHEKHKQSVLAFIMCIQAHVLSQKKPSLPNKEQVYKGA